MLGCLGQLREQIAVDDSTLLRSSTLFSGRALYETMVNLHPSDDLGLVIRSFESLVLDCDPEVLLSASKILKVTSFVDSVTRVRTPERNESYQPARPA